MLNSALVVVASALAVLSVICGLCSYRTKRATGVLSVDWVLGVFSILGVILCLSLYYTDTVEDFGVVKVTQYGNTYEAILDNGETVTTTYTVDTMGDDWTLSRTTKTFLFGQHSEVKDTLNIPAVGITVYDSNPTEESVDE